MFATWSGFPPGGQPGARGGGAAATTAVAADVAVVLPPEFVAVTPNRSVLWTSAEVSLYAVPLAPMIEAQDPPFLSQRSQE